MNVSGWGVPGLGAFGGRRVGGGGGGNALEGAAGGGVPKTPSMKLPDWDPVPRPGAGVSKEGSETLTVTPLANPLPLQQTIPQVWCLRKRQKWSM